MIQYIRYDRVCIEKSSLMGMSESVLATNVNQSRCKALTLNGRPILWTLFKSPGNFLGRICE